MSLIYNPPAPKLPCKIWTMAELWTTFDKHFYQNSNINLETLYPQEFIKYYKTIAMPKYLVIVTSFHHCYTIFKEKNLLKFIQKHGIFIAVVWLMPIETYYHFNPNLGTAANTSIHRSDDRSNTASNSGYLFNSDDNQLQLKTIYNTHLLAEKNLNEKKNETELRHLKFQLINKNQSNVFFNKFKKSILNDKFLSKLPNLNLLENPSYEIKQNFLENIYKK